ncbi:MAG: CRISPR-associated helicase/endonuclease Cas3 [Bacillus thermozeamaize]|uniref:CRISPR-associated helicase/endonuclease Cas3 n=1 Tax=Bacillus thermozeamaize TaxID=230954 RepID=A0A1Y3PMF5_9BACI|nr:MAG: CRISPR-associated helicase/endonuclease Cas3 [Bacillus thermozeamaize]
MFLAKSNPPQTIREHTDKLLEMMEWLKNQYGDRMPLMDRRMWELLEIAVRYHDVGKADSAFQYRVQKRLQDQLKLEPVQPVHDEQVPHNYLSAGLIPQRELNLTKEELYLLTLAVGYHHERDQLPEKEAIRRVLEEDIRLRLRDLAAHMDLIFPEGEISYRFVDRLRKRLRPTDGELFWRYVMLKGLLHRLDHTASDPSDYLTVEADVEQHIQTYAKRYFMQKGLTPNELQQFAASHQDRHVIAIAQTGMGKTEAALFWIGQDKAFFTLPLRVSINAIYERITDPKGIGYPAAGLLHSASVDYLTEKGEERWEQIRNQSRHLASKLVLTTIDQILKFPFLYRGFEKELATMAYSKVVIDEIQAYDPKIVAMLIRALEMIHHVGGKFMIMTATMPAIYLDKLRKRGNIPREMIAEGQFLDPSIVRHRIQLRDEPITDALEEIIEKGRTSQVLVIVNTVRLAVRVYELLSKQVPANFPVYLLHALFTLGDRQRLERFLLEFNKQRGKKSGVWITTQLVEASLDVDFDWLFTELSTLDSLFQRLGRCYRKRLWTERQANVYVFTQELSGVPSVYDRFLVEEGLELLKNYDGKVLDEPAKVEMVRELYSRHRLKGSAFLKELEEALDWFDNLDPYQMDRKEAQEKLRDIEQVMVLPRPLWDAIEPLIQKYKEAETFSQRHELRRQIERWTVSVRYNQVRNKLSMALPEGLEHIYLVEAGYDFDETNLRGKGLLLNTYDPFL